MMSGRNLAPRPTTQLPESSSTGSRRESSGPSQPQPTTNVSVRKKVTSACLGCQKRRVKCDGGHPCATCVRTKTECSYTPELDGRSIKRKYHEVQRDQDLLENLLETIRYTKDENVNQIISLIRSDASLEDIKFSISQKIKETQLSGRELSPELRQLQSSLGTVSREVEEQVRPTDRSSFLEIGRLADKPLYKVPASPWTTVTADDDLVSNLISACICWDKGWQDWIGEEIFIREMQTGSTTSLFCSPFLVNCLLAWACPYSDYKEARTVNGNISPLMMDFIAEAKRLLEDECTTGLCMTTIQGLFILHGAMAVAGIDTAGYRYMLEGVGLTQELMASYLTVAPQFDVQTSREVLDSIDRTCWGVFILSTQYYTTILRAQTMMQPPRRPKPRHHGNGTLPRVWRPYQPGGASIPSYADELFDFGCDLGIIEAELSRILFDVETQLTNDETRRQLLILYQKLQDRTHQMPPQLTPQLRSCPSLFSSWIRIQATILRIFMTLREPGRRPPSQTALMARTKCAAAALEIARIAKLYMQSWGASRLGVMICHPVFVGVSILLEEQKTDIYVQAISDMCVGLRAMSRRWPLAVGILRMLQLEVRSKGWELPVETKQLFDEFERSTWRQRELKRFVTRYPESDATKAANPVGEGDMGTFLEKMETLALEDPELDYQGDY